MNRREITLHVLALFLAFIAIVLIIKYEGIENGAPLIAAIIASIGVIITVWSSQTRNIHQQDREDRRQNERLELERHQAREDRRTQFQLDRHQREQAEYGQRLQISTQQRIEMSNRREAAVNRLLSENGIERSVAINDLFFQIDDWQTLIQNEISSAPRTKKAYILDLQRESVRRRQELFNLAVKLEDNDISVVSARARNLQVRLNEKVQEPSVVDLNMTGLELCSKKDAPYRPSLAGFKVPAKKDLSKSKFDNCLLDEADFSGSTLDRASFKYCTLNNADLKETEGYSINFHGCEISISNFGGANLYRADFAKAILIGANFDGAILYSSTFQQADIRGGSFEKADLGGADMSFSSMVFTRFSNARLAYCKLDRARFGACSIDGTKFGFSSVKDTLFTDMVSVQGEEIVGEGPALKLSTATDWTGVDLSIAKVNSRNFCVEEELKKPELEYKRTMAEYRNFNDLS